MQNRKRSEDYCSHYLSNLFVKAVSLLANFLPMTFILAPCDWTILNYF